jgi:hypothetical protein
MCIEVKLSIVERSDNMGASFMVHKKLCSLYKTCRHVHYFIYEHVVDTFINIIFAKLCDTDIDLFTKHV